MIIKKKIKGYMKAVRNSNLAFYSKKLIIGNYNEETGDKCDGQLSYIKSKPDGVMETDNLVILVEA